MSLHYLEPEREPRSCPGCPSCHYTLPSERAKMTMPDCHGIGLLGEKGAEPDVEVEHFWANELLLQADAGFYYHLASEEWGASHGPFKSESAALSAARTAHRASSGAGEVGDG